MVSGSKRRSAHRGHAHVSPWRLAHRRSACSAWLHAAEPWQHTDSNMAASQHGGTPEVRACCTTDCGSLA